MNGDGAGGADGPPRGWLLGIADFRRLWVVGLMVLVVRWLEVLAVGIFTYQETSSAFLVAMMTMLRLLPMGLFGAVLGAVAERLERRSALIVVLLAMLATSAVIALLATFDALEVWHLAVAGLVNGLGWATDNPIRRMMIGDAVGAARMGPAMSLDVGTSNASRMLGPTVGGMVLAHFGIAGVFWLGVALYAVALAAALRIELRSRTGATDGASVLQRVLEGLAWARGDRRLRGVLTVTVIYNIFGWPATSMIPVLGKDLLQLGPEGVGLLAALDGVGAFAGALAIATFGRPHWYGRIYVGGTAIFLAMFVAFALTPAVVPAGAALLLLGIGGAGFGVMQATLVYMLAPVEMRGRLLGLLSVCIGVGPVGFFYLGFLAELLGAQAATVALAAQGLLALLLARSWWRAIG